MKRWVLGIGYLLVAFTALAREQEFRAFASADGRMIEARIVELNAQKGKLKIERRDGNMLWVSPDIFSEADRLYIKEWVAAEFFISESWFKISVEKHIESGTKSKNGSLPEIVGSVYYEVQLQNRSDTTFNQLQLDYQIHIGKKMYGAGSAPPRIVEGKARLKSLPGGSRKKCRTKTEKLLTKFRSSTIYNSKSGVSETSISKMSKEAPEGILIRIQGPVVDGVPVVRELSYPSNFSKEAKWYESTAKKESKPAGALTYDELIQKARALALYSKGNKDYEKVIALYEQAIKLDPTKTESIEYDIFSLRLRMRTELSLSLAEEWAEKEDSLEPYRKLADFYGLQAPAELLNGEKAVKYATKAAEKNYNSTVETLATAYARNGQFDLAVETMAVAIKKLKRTKYSKARLKQYKSLHALFEQGKAYNEGMKL